MPLERIAKLEALTEHLTDIVVMMQQVADFRQEKANIQLKMTIDETAALQQEIDNIQETLKTLNADLSNVHIKLHQLSNYIMALGDKVDQQAEFTSILEENQIQLRTDLGLTSNDERKVNG